MSNINPKEKEIVRILEENREFKSYRALCAALGWKPTNHHSKDAQFKTLEQCCRYHKEGNKILIDEVFDEPKPKIDKRKDKDYIPNDKYGTLMDNLTLKFISEYETTGQFYSFGTIFKEYIPLFQKDSYNKYMRLGYKKFSIMHNVSKGLVNQYFGFMRGKVRESFERSLNRLQKKNIIVWDYKFGIFRSRQKESELATDEETKELKKCEYDALDKMIEDGELKKRSKYILDPVKRKKYHDLTIDYFNETTNDEIKNYWPVYIFDITDKKYENMEVQTDMNSLIINYLKEIHKSIEKVTYPKNEFDYAFGEPLHTYYKYPYRSEPHKISTYKLDQLFWNLPENWYDDFMYDYRLIFPDDNPDDWREKPTGEKITLEEMKELGWDDKQTKEECIPF